MTNLVLTVVDVEHFQNIVKCPHTVTSDSDEQSLYALQVCSILSLRTSNYKEPEKKENEVGGKSMSKIKQHRRQTVIHVGHERGGQPAAPAQSRPRGPDKSH